MITTRKRRAWLAPAAVLVVIATVAVWLRDRRDLRAPNPRHRRQAADAVTLNSPALVRFLPVAGSAQTGPCWGLVLAAPAGLPEQVLDLCRASPGLGGGLDDLIDQGGFAVAERMFELARRGQVGSAWIERLPRETLATRILSPVDSTLEQLERQQRMVVGVGFNYAAHADDADADAGEDGFLFAKMVAPTGAYAPITLGPPTLPLALFAQLVDYEVELAFVLLEEIRLDDLPSEQELATTIAWVQANDVSDRWPILLRGDAGFTLAKSRPTYLPLGPWLVHGRHLEPRTSRGGRDEVELSLRVDEPNPDEAGSHRQYATSREMARGPLAILELAARVWRRSLRPDAGGEPRGIARVEAGRPVLPRGTLILTGTPSGTAIEAPQGVDKLRLFLLGNLSTERARLAYAEHCVRNRREMGFLSPGDVVDASVDRLGRQRWAVEP